MNGLEKFNYINKSFDCSIGTNKKTKKSLNISNGEAEPVNGRMTDNTMAKMKGSNNDGQNTTQKIKDGAIPTPLNTGSVLTCSRC